MLLSRKNTERIRRRSNVSSRESCGCVHTLQAEQTSWSVGCAPQCIRHIRGVLEKHQMYADVLPVLVTSIATRMMKVRALKFCLYPFFLPLSLSPFLFLSLFPIFASTPYGIVAFWLRVLCCALFV